MDATAPVSEFKAHLSQYLRSVQNGSELIILDHNRPIARVVPIASENMPEKLTIIPAKTKKLVDMKLKIKLDVDPAQYVIEDREDRIY